MKRKNLLKVLSAAGVMAAVGLAIPMTQNQNIYASQDTILRLANQNTVENTSTYQRDIPKDWYGTTKQFGGLTLNIQEDGSISATAAANPSEVEELLLYAQLGSGAVNYDNLSLSAYTNLKDVVLVTNLPTAFTTLLTQIPSFTNLYVSGSVDFGEALTKMNFESLYLCFTYIPSRSINISDFYSNLAGSSLKHIYYNDFFATNCSDNLSTLGTVTNKNSETITVEQISGDLKYPEEVFYPFSGFSARSSYLGCTSIFRASALREVQSRADITELMVTIDDAVKDFVYTGTSTANLIKEHTYETLVMPNIISYNLNGISAKEVVVPIANNKSIDVNYLKGIEAIRFLPVNNGGTVKLTATLYDSSTSKLKKILIPKGYEDSFTLFTERSDLSPLIEYYDLESYKAPTSSFTYLDETISCNGGYTIEEAIQEVIRLQGLGLDYKAKPIDEIASDYELPYVYADSLKDNYSLRDMTTIILFKDMNLDTVIEEFKDFMPLNNGRICDPEGFTITNINKEKYTKGSDGEITLSVKFKDNSVKNATLYVKQLTQESPYAYILDSNDNINVIAPKTIEKSDLSTMVTPLMTNYLNETSVEYTASKLLDTTYETLCCANFYKASTTEGKIRVAVTSKSLTGDGTTTPDTDNPGSGTDTPTEPSTKEDTDAVDTEGYEMKEITGIYTTSKVDGTKLISNLENYMLTYNGDIVNTQFAVGYNQHDNTKDYEMTISTSITETDMYKKAINVKIIDNPYDLGFVMFSDGSIAVEYYSNNLYSNDDIINGIKAFLESQNLPSDNVVLNQRIPNRRTFKGSYQNGELYIVDSSYNISYNSKDNPVDDSAYKKDYRGITEIGYTKDYTAEEAMRIVARKMLLFDGEPVEDYDISFTTRADSDYIGYKIIKDDKEIYQGTAYMKKIESDYNYVYARVSQFEYANIYIEKLDKDPDYKLNDVMKDFISQFRVLLGTFDNDANISFTKTNNTTLAGVYRVGNGNYCNYEFNVYVDSNEHLIKSNKATVDGKEELGETFKDKFNNFFDSLKEKFEENNVFKILTITLGSILGLAIIYLVFKFIRWIFRWFRK